MATDPATGQELPESAIQRIVFIANDVHVYGIPPISSNRGFSAALWTSPTQATAQQIFTGRLRIVETSIESNIKTDIVLEDTSSGELFAAAPYTSTAVVQQANDSSRFFAVRVQGEGGMKATLGIGFEDRSPALDFNIALGEAQKVLGIGGAGATTQTGRGAQDRKNLEQESKQDFGLKEGEKIHVELGGKGRRSAPMSASESGDDASALFSIAPPPGAGRSPNESAPTAPSSSLENKSAKDLGFDDGESGEFQ